MSQARSSYRQSLSQYILRWALEVPEQEKSNHLFRDFYNFCRSFYFKINLHMFEYKKSLLRCVVLVAAIIIFSVAGSARAEEASSSALIHLTIKASSTELFSGDVNTIPCDSDGAGTMALTAYCAVSQAHVSSTWSWWGSDAFLDSINGITNDNANGWYWGWFSNLAYGETALNKYALTSGDQVLVVLNSAPLKLSVSSASPAVGESVVLTVQEFGYDESWNPVWKPSAQSHLISGANDFAVNNDGTYTLAITTADPVVLYARKDGNFVQSPSLTITPMAAASDNGANNNNSTGGSIIQAEPETEEKPEFDLGDAVDFLLHFQSGDGGFGEKMYTDWAAIALKAAARAGNAQAQTGLTKVKEYLLDKSLSDSASLTDNERRALALMTVGINPYTDTKVDYIDRITREFDGEQFGDAGLENDDIFALLVLMKAGYKSSDEMIAKTVSFLLSRQKSSGAWIGVDLTAAAMQALAPLRGIEGVDAALLRAEDYILAAQNDDGGFGNIYSLSWALQALDGALTGADDALAAEQEDDGGFGEQSASDENRLWATSYAIPAALHRSWPELMSSFRKVEPKADNNTSDTNDKKEVIEVKKGARVVVEAVSEPVEVTSVATAPVIAKAPVAEDVPQAVPAEEAADEGDVAPQEERIPFVASAVDSSGGNENNGTRIYRYGRVAFGVLGGLFLLSRLRIKRRRAL